MKILALFALVALISAQSPVPLPSLNLQQLQGQWWVVWEFSADINNQVANPVTCLQYNIDIGSDGAVVSQSFNYNGQSFNSQSNYTPLNSGNSVWGFGSEGSDMKSNITWVGVDPISASWYAAGGSAQNAFIISKNPTLSNVVLTAESLVLKGEGYALNSTNQYFFNNTGC